MCKFQFDTCKRKPMKYKVKVGGNEAMSMSSNVKYLSTLKVWHTQFFVNSNSIIRTFELAEMY